MSDSLDSCDREKRAFDALIVSNLLRDRDVTNLDDLPELSESERAAMNAVPSDIVDKLWDSTADACLEKCEALQEESVEEDELFAAANRAEDMDEETLKKLEEARKVVRETMRKTKKKSKDDVDS
jgi:hypothetical protein